MPRPKGLPKTGGRKPGTPNKVTPDVRLAAREYTIPAIERLAKIMAKADSDAAAVSACRELLDRGWGRPTQALTGADDKPLFPAIVVTFPDAGAD